MWIRPAPLGKKLDPIFPQIAIQAWSLDKPVYTNIHTEISMEYARKWAAQARNYYKIRS